MVSNVSDRGRAGVGNARRVHHVLVCQSGAGGGGTNVRLKL